VFRSCPKNDSVLTCQFNAIMQAAVSWLAIGLRAWGASELLGGRAGAVSESKKVLSRINSRY